MPRPVSSPTIPPAAYAQSVARIQAVADHEVALQTTAGPDGLFLQPHTESIFKAQPGPTARGTVVMYHGYTAAPWQFNEMAQRFYDSGYNVYVPRLPGHGYVDGHGMPTGAKIPHPDQRCLWEAFAESTYRDAAALGAPVYTVGLSGGADVALYAAAHHADVAGVVALAPFLGGNLPKGIAYPVFNALDAVTLGAVDNLLDHVPMHHNHPAKHTRMPHTQGSLGQAVLLEQMGRRIRSVGCPIQFFTVDGDGVSGSQEVGAIFTRSGGAAKNGWYHFHADEGVPHAMLSPLQNRVPGAAQAIQDMVFDFVDQGKRAQRD